MNHWWFAKFTIQTLITMSHDINNYSKQVGICQRFPLPKDSDGKYTKDFFYLKFALYGIL